MKAHRSFHQLRDRERFRSWLVRLTWRLALDRRCADRRRAAREQGQIEQTAQYTTAADKVSGEVVKVDVTVNVIK